jgi:CubicO group peptidase (beta-lactamase class C family)
MNCFGAKTPRALGFAAVIVSLLFFPFSSSAQKKPAPHPGATGQQLEKDIPELMKNHGVPGLSIALIRDGKTTWVHGFGIKEAHTDHPVTDETIFEAASLSKPVFAYGALKLVEQDKLGLDVPLTTYLPKPYIPDDRLTKITARIVLSHRTGFPSRRAVQLLR